MNTFLPPVGLSSLAKQPCSIWALPFKQMIIFSGWRTLQHYVSFRHKNWCFWLSSFLIFHWLFLSFQVKFFVDTFKKILIQQSWLKRNFLYFCACIHAKFDHLQYPMVGASPLVTCHLSSQFFTSVTKFFHVKSS